MDFKLAVLRIMAEEEYFGHPPEIMQQAVEDVCDVLETCFQHKLDPCVVLTPNQHILARGFLRLVEDRIMA